MGRTFCTSARHCPRSAECGRALTPEVVESASRAVKTLSLATFSPDDPDLCFVGKMEPFNDE